MPGKGTLSFTLKKLAKNQQTAVTRASESLDILLNGVYRSPWQKVAWEFSKLNGDGYPVEFAFTSADEAIRYTAEVAGPEVDLNEKLSIAEKKLKSLGSFSLPQDMSYLFHEIQELGPLNFGAWIGGRHGFKEDNYKIYVEVPKNDSYIIDSLISDLIGKFPAQLSQRSRLQMIGFEPKNSRIELYFHLECVELWEIGLLLDKSGLYDQLPSLLQILGEAYNCSVELVIPKSTIGFSYSIPPDGGSKIFSLFKYARSVFGGDGNIRRRLLALAARRRWNFTDYTTISKPLANRKGWKTWHTIVAFTVSQGNQLNINIGLRPPEENYEG